MTVKSKVILLSVFITCCLVAALFLLLIHNLNGFLEKRALEDAARLRSAFLLLFEKEKNGLEEHIPDYTMWTELGERAVVERNEAWIKENLEPWVREQFGYSVLLVEEGGEMIAISPDWPFQPGEFPPSSLSKAVFLRSGDDLWVVVTGEVTNDEGDKEYGAFLSFARRLDAELFREWSQILGCEIEDVSSGVFPPEWSNLPSFWQNKCAFTQGGYLYVDLEIPQDSGGAPQRFLLRKRYD
ncbi:MAG: hypothetical protein J7J32_02085, partial [Candidatus Atribacteria bacterium]|nr:hypothetical protein [Candidatus Atribacteria bacterium]MCD6350227.1 hypothetical protein [Candidatus Atribacteria bacterium]